MQLASLRRTGQDDREELQVFFFFFFFFFFWIVSWRIFSIFHLTVHVNDFFNLSFQKKKNRTNSLFFNPNLTKKPSKSSKKRKMLPEISECWRKKHKNMLRWWLRLNIWKTNSLFKPLLFLLPLRHLHLLLHLLEEEEEGRWIERRYWRRRWRF